MHVKYSVSESNVEVFEQFAKQIEEEEKFVTQEIMSQVEKEEALPLLEADVSLMLGYEIKDNPVPLQMIQEEEKKIAVQGTVFGLDTKELKNGMTLFTFNLTDFTDSLMMKVFAKNKEDLRILSLLANGKWIRARGKVEYDRFMQVPELVMILRTSTK